ncbi:tetratricopeptide repeat protein [Streptomyces sp. NPDC058049]|uniref:tetratricopeptide repeat protein n=1 Tax=Streptomyces sp. NPDC058049 TaxID=3346314 RepID=UPI0036E6B7D0
MSRDGVGAKSGVHGKSSGTSRAILRPVVPPGPLRDLKELIYLAYTSAGAPTLDEMAGLVAADDALAASPSRDTVGRIVGDATVPAKQADVVALITVLSRMAAGEVTSTVQDAARLWRQARLAEPIGRPIGELDPHALEVHHAIANDGATGLPAYVEREHDARLRAIVAEVVEGSSRLVMLVGTSSTGKTRACWEAVQRLPAGWRLWHPIDPERPQAALADLARVGPRTVVWLNEAQHYLLSEQHGEAIAAGLRELLADTSRGPVLILGTIWPGPDHFDKLTHQPTADAPDAFSQARVLLGGREIRLPTAFTPPVIEVLKQSTDPRLAEAAAHAQDGMVTQYLAGAPELIKIYRTSSPGTRSVLEAAMDARRLGHPPGLPLSFLETAAEAYLTDTEWDLLPDNWLPQSLTLLTDPVKGARGPLHPQRRPRGASRTSSAPVGQTYRLADFLDQHGRAIRRLERVPELFWPAAIEHCGPRAARALASSAEERGLSHIACRLWARGGDLTAVGRILVRSGRLDEALTWYEQAADHRALEEAAVHLVQAGRWDEADAWIERAAAAGSRSVFLQAAESLRRADRWEEALAWYERAAVDGDHDTLLRVADRLAAVGRWEEALAWYERAAVDGDHDALLRVAGRLAAVGRWDEALTWYERAAETDQRALRTAADRLADAGRWEEALTWYERAAVDGNPDTFRSAADRLADFGRWDEALAWYERAVQIGDRNALLWAGDRLAAADRWDEALAWYERAAASGSPQELRSVAERLGDVGRLDEALAWYERAARSGNEDALLSAAGRLVKADRQDEALAWYERAAETSGPVAFRWAAERLWRVGKTDEALALYERAARAGDQEALLWAADRLVDAERLDEAMSCYERAVTTTNHKQLRATAERLAPVGKLDDALIWFERAAANGDQEAFGRAADCLADAGRLDEALAWYERAAATADTQEARWWPMNGRLHTRSVERAIGVLRELGRATEADALKRYGWDPSGRIAAPWDLKPSEDIAPHPAPTVN